MRDVFKRGQGQVTQVGDELDLGELHVVAQDIVRAYYERGRRSRDIDVEGAYRQGRLEGYRDASNEYLHVLGILDQFQAALRGLINAAMGANRMAIGAGVQSPLYQAVQKASPYLERLERLKR